MSLPTSRNLVCATPLTLHFAHTHTQWSTWHEDDRKDGILRCCKFYMSYGTFVSLCTYTCCLFILPHNLTSYYLYTCFNKVNPWHDCITIVLGKELFIGGIRVLRRHISSFIGFPLFVSLPQIDKKLPWCWASSFLCYSWVIRQNFDEIK